MGRPEIKGHAGISTMTFKDVGIHHFVNKLRENTIVDEDAERGSKSTNVVTYA